MLAVFIDNPLVAQPGTSVHYSSFGYSLASIVLEAATGATFQQLLADEIAGPFAMPTLGVDHRARLIPIEAKHSATIAPRTPRASTQWPNCSPAIAHSA